MPWANGGGTSYEIASDRDTQGEWSWRIALAPVREDGDFFRMPCVDRKLLLVEGTCVLITAPLQMMIGWLAFHAAAKAGVTDIFHQIMVAVAVTLAVVIGLWIVHKWLDSRKSKKRPKRASVQWLRVFGRSRPLAAGAAHRG